MALPHATYAAVAARDDDTVTVSSACSPTSRSTGALDALGPGGDRLGGVRRRRAVGDARGRLEVPGMDLVVDSRVPLGAGLSSSAALECAVALAAAEARRRDARRRGPRRAGARPACAPSARSRARPPAAWTRPSRCSASRRRRCCSTAATGRPRQVPLGPGGGGPDPAGRGHPRVALARGRRLRLAPRGLRGGRRPARRRPAARRRRTRTPRSASLDDERCGRRVRHVFTRDRPGPRGGRRCSRPATVAGLGATFLALARVPARRLRGVLRGARRGRRRPRWRTARSAPG